MNLQRVLAGCLSPDAQIRSQAEAALNDFTKQPESILQLLHHLQSSPAMEERQLAATVMRQKIKAYWRKIPTAGQAGVKDALLGAITQEPASSVCRMEADAVAYIAKDEVPANAWPQLLPWLDQCCTKGDAKQQLTGLRVLTALLERIGVYMVPHLDALSRVCSNLMASESSELRQEAITALIALCPLVVNDAHVAKFQQLVPRLLQISQAIVASQSNEEEAEAALRMFAEFAECPAPLLGKAVSDILTWSLQVGSSRQLSTELRHQALQVVDMIASKKPKQFVRAVRPTLVVQALCNMIMEPGILDAEEDDMPASRIAGQTLDSLSLALTSKHILPEALACAHQAISSPEAHVRHAACTIALVVVEGCADAIKEKRLPEMLQIVAQGMQDSHPKVRGQAAFALGQLAEHCQPEIMEHARQALPLLFGVLQASPDQDTQEQAFYALVAFCESLEEMPELLQPLMERLAQGLQHGSPEVQQSAITALASAASCVQDAFKPYAQQVLPLLYKYLLLTEEDMLSCRARATEAVGIIAHAVGLEEASGHLQRCLVAAIEGLVLDHSELREHTHGLLVHTAELLHADFAPWLPKAVSAALASCAQDDGAVEGDSDEDDDNSGSVSLGDDSDTDVAAATARAIGAERAISIRTAVCDEKAAATSALGVYAEETQAAFGPFLEQSLKCLLGMCIYFHETVRAQAFEALPRVLAATLAAFPPPAEGTVSPQGQHLINEAFPLLLTAIRSDLDKPAVSSALSAAAALLQTGGLQACQAHVVPLAKGAAKVLNGQAPCQEADSDDEGNDEIETEEGDEEEQELMLAAMEVLPVLAAKLPATDWAPLFQRTHAPLMLKLCQPSQPDDIRAAAIGAMGEIARESPGALQGLEDGLCQALVKELKGEVSTNRRNAAFACGTVLQAAAQNGTIAQLAGRVNNILQALHPLFSSEEEDGVRDNAIGAAARIISAQAAPQQLLPQMVEAVVRALPLKEDFDEAGAVYGMLCTLAGGLCSSPQLSHLLPLLLQAFGQVATEEIVAEGVRKQVAGTVAHLQATQGASVLPMLQHLPPDQRGALQDLTNHFLTAR